MEKGDVRELWKVSYPMMVSFFSMALMMFVDRIFLSWYATDALNASVQAGTLAWSIILGWITMATMSEVFVAQYNGAKKHSEIGSPVWQMIWLTLASFLFYIPAAIWLSPAVYNPLTRPQEHDYFRLFLYMGPIFAMIPAIGGFYIGQGKTQVMQWMALLGNLLNIILDPIFIFGIKGICPAMGVKGAAIATGLGSLAEALLLAYLFMRKSNRIEFGTGNFRWNTELFLKTVKIGLPPALFVCLEVAGWAAFYHLMAQMSAMHILVASLCQSIWILLMFFGMGVEKGAIALAGNFIGANQRDKVQTVLLSGVKLITLFVLAASILLIIFPDLLIDVFFSSPDFFDHPGQTLTALDMEEMRSSTRVGLAFIALYMFFENIRWVLNGILTAAGDTLFLLISGTVCLWLLLLLPTYYLIVVPGTKIVYAFGIWVAYASIATGITFIRFSRGQWKERKLVEEDELL